MSARLVSRLVAGASALSLVAAASGRAQCPDGTPPPCEVHAARAVARQAPPPESVRARTFLVLPFRNVRALPGDEWLIEGSPTLLAGALGRWRELSVVPDERVYPALRRHGLTPGEVMAEDRVRRVAEETGGWIAVTGEIVRLGQRTRISARAYDVAGGRVVGHATEESAIEDDIQEAYERLATRLLTSVGLGPSDVELASATTQSLEALKAYVRGIQHYNRAEMRRARAAFEEAVRLDSTFAQAYAKLAAASLVSVRALTDPQHRAYQYAERGAALAAHLSPQNRTLLQGINEVYHGQFAVARRTLEGVLAEDSANVEALTALATVEIVDQIVVTVDGAPRARGSLERAVRLAKRAVALDPIRHEGYATLVTTYLVAGGFLQGIVPGYGDESASLAAHLQSLPVQVFAVLLRDTLEEVPLQEALRAGEDSLRALREPARRIARAWVERWLAATPNVAEAHLWAARVHELDERPRDALAALTVAESLGVETEFEPLVARRMILLGKAGRFGDAGRLADSLVRAGSVPGPDVAFNRLGREHAAWAFKLLLDQGQFDRAGTLLAQVQEAVRAGGVPPETARRAAVVSLCRSVDIEGPLMRVARAALAAVDRMSAEPLMVDCVSALLVAAAEGGDSAYRASLAREALDAAGRVGADPARRRLGHDLVITAAMQVDSAAAFRQLAYDYFAAAVARDSGDMAALYQVGRMALFTGEHLEVAANAFTRYIKHEPHPNDPPLYSAHWRLGMVYELLGKRDLARGSYRAALRLNPGHEPSRAALARLGDT